MSAIRRNLKAAWERVEADDIASGSMAYPNYHRTIRDLAERYGIPFERAVLAFVILSPSNSLMGNLRGLKTCIVAHGLGIPAGSFTVSGYGKWRHRAMEALAGRVTLGDLQGPKIRAFYDNILDPWGSRHVCVDGHMICIAAGKDMTMVEAQMWSRGLGYRALLRAVEADVVGLARRVRLPPPAVQAILWTARKREKGIRPDEWPRNLPIAPDRIRIFRMKERKHETV